MNTLPRLRVALVDDNPHDRAEIKSLLLRGSTRRYAFIEAETGAEGLRACRASPPPDCLVLDFDLPDMNAIELLESLPHTGLDPEIPVVVLTGVMEETSSAELLRAGAQDFVGKDWMTEGSLTRAVENAIERLRATRELRASEQLNRSLMEGITESVAVLGLDGTLLHLNGPGLCGLQQTKLGPLRGREWASLWPKPAREPLREAVARARTGDPVDALVMSHTSGGTQTWWDVTISSIRDVPEGPIVRLLAISRDVTLRRQNERALRDSEERLRLAMKAVALGTFERDLIGDSVRWDLRARAILGLDEPTTTTAAFLDRVAPDDREQVRGHIEAKTDSSAPVEYRVYLPDGRVRWIETHVAVESADQASDRPVRVIGTVEDITARKHNEAALRENEEWLRESDRRKDEFLAILGHELRNPLAAIRSASELIELSAPTDPRLRTVHAVLERQSGHMIRLIDGLLEVSRIARGKIILERQPLELRSVLEGVLVDCDPLLARSGLSVRVDLTDEPLWVCGDPVRLAQVFDNLIGNAVKFTPPPGTIHVILAADGAEAVFRVRDTGVGIRADLLAHVFEPFRQETQDIARSSGGLGLGLALVRGLVELHEGSVEVHSAGPGTGSEFTIRLPRVASPTLAR